MLNGKNWKSVLIRILVFVVAFAIAMPVVGTEQVYAAKKSKKPGKICGGTTYSLNGTDYSSPKAKSSVFWMPASRAKKYQIYRSYSVKGKYKKIKTVSKKKNEIDVKSPQGLVCYKVRGINGKKKGKFSPVLVAYGFKTKVEEVRHAADGYGCIMKVKVTNTAKHSRDMTFYNPSGGGIGCTAFGYDDFEKTYGKSDGYYCDANGSYVKGKTIKAGQTGYLYIWFSNDNMQNYYNRAMNPSGDIELAIDQVFYIKDGKVKKYFNGYSFMRVGHGITYNDIEYEAGDVD